MRPIIVVSSILLCLLCACSDSDSDGGAGPGTAPVAPTGLSVTGTGLTSLTLSWNASDKATEYILYRSESASGNFAQVYTGTATEFADGDLVYVTTYYYEVSALNSAGESAHSNPVSATTDTPTGFTVTGSPSGVVDYTFNYLDDFNGRPRYQSDPIGLNIVVPTGGDQAGMWCFYDQIESITRYYHPTASSYPPPTGWRAVVGDVETSIQLTPFIQ